MCCRLVPRSVNFEGSSRDEHTQQMMKGIIIRLRFTHLILSDSRGGGGWWQGVSGFFIGTALFV